MENSQMHKIPRDAVTLQKDGYGLETGTLRLQRLRLVMMSRGSQGHDVTFLRKLTVILRRHYEDSSRLSLGHTVTILSTIAHD